MSDERRIRWTNAPPPQLDVSMTRVRLVESNGGSLPAGEASPAGEDLLKCLRQTYNELVLQLRYQQTLVQHALQQLYELEGQADAGPGYGMPHERFYGALIDVDRPVSMQGLTFEPAAREGESTEAETNPISHEE